MPCALCPARCATRCRDAMCDVRCLLCAVRIFVPAGRQRLAGRLSERSEAIPPETVRSMICDPGRITDSTSSEASFEGIWCGAHVTAKPLEWVWDGLIPALRMAVAEQAASEENRTDLAETNDRLLPVPFDSQT